MNETDKSHAYSFDFDDTIIQRNKLVRKTDVLRDYIRGRRSGWEFQEAPISDWDTEFPDSFKSRLAVFGMNRFQSDVFPGVEEFLENAARNGIKIYGNTGRPHIAGVVRASERTLEKGQIRDYFEKIYYAPYRSRSAESKAGVLSHLDKQHDSVTHFDDDMHALRFLATEFPHMDFVHVDFRLGSHAHLAPNRLVPSNIQRVGHVNEYLRKEKV
ncbi:MAG: hypothetical protein KA035_00375 [Candidatus Levybacteria bacterium]|nr:hypothetical protein [Candidatus Levybacteria bacterium]